MNILLVIAGKGNAISGDGHASPQQVRNRSPGGKEDGDTTSKWGLIFDCASASKRQIDKFLSALGVLCG